MTAANLPRFDMDIWEGDSQVYFESNCYNYALNIITSRYSGGAFLPCLNPGELALRRKLWPDRKRIQKALKNLKDPETLLQKMFDPKRFEHYVASRVKNFTDDGLRFIGTEAAIPEDGYPIALFFRGTVKDSHSWFRRMDYHWYCLRQDEVGNPFWACKFLNGGVDIMNGESIFTHAFERGYDYFAGYFCRPYNLDV